MEEIPKDLPGKLGDAVAKWAGYSAIGSFLLYLFGYLVLRFQLTAYGVATNLDVLDEKYLFAGSRFFIFLGMTLPNLLLVLTIVLLPLYGISRLVPVSQRSRIQSSVSSWLARPYALRIIGCIAALLLIQLVLRQCFLFSNVLLLDRLPQFWLTSILLAGEGAQSFYFTGLVLGVGLTVLIAAFVLYASPAPGHLAPLLTVLLVFFVGLEILLLPVNYGILVGSTSLPRVSQIENQTKLATGVRAWLVWDTKETLTYLVCENNSRTLLSIPKKENKVSIVGYDAIFQAAVRPPCSPPN